MAPSTSDTDQAQATFGRYAETPDDQMTPEQQEGYRILAKAGGRATRAGEDLGRQYEPRQGGGAAGGPFHPPNHSLTTARAQYRRLHHSRQWHAPFPINAHNPVAIELAISPAVAGVLLCGQPTLLEDQREQTVYELAMAWPLAATSPRACTTARSRSSVMIASRTSPS